MKRLLVILLSLLIGGSLYAQQITNASYHTVAHISKDGTIQDASYRTIGHAKGIPLAWAALYFFFSN